MGHILDEYVAKICIEKKWDVWTENRPKMDFLLVKTRPYLKYGNRVCEVGVGDGYLLDRLYNLGLDCTGIDISDYLVRHHKERVAREKRDIKFILGDIAKLELQPQSYEAVFCVDILEHLEGAELAFALKNIYHMLKPNGIIVVSFPYRENLYASMTICPRCAFEFHRIGHKQSFDLEKIESVFKPLFEIKEIGEVDWDLPKKIPFFKRRFSIEGCIKRIAGFYAGAPNGRKPEIQEGKTCWLIAVKRVL